MRTFAPLAERDLPVPGELLDALVDTLGPPGPWVLIGATARDLALILGGVTLPRRATNDVDIAVAAHDAGDFDALLDRTLSDLAFTDHLIVSVADTMPPAADWSRMEKIGRALRALGPVHPPKP